MKRRVVISGIGAVTPIGTGREGLWDGAMAAKSGVRSITLFDASPFNSQIAAEVPDFDPSAWFDHKRLKRLDRYSLFALASAKMALEDSGLDLAAEDRDRIGVCIGSALGGVGTAEREHINFLQGGVKAVSPTLALLVFGGAASCNIAIEFGLSGPATANGDSCASAPIAMGNALRYIQRGDADVMLAGAAESPLSPLCFGAFAIIRAMSTRNDDPAGACRPFDRGRDGFVMGEGSAMLVLEERSRAIARGAHIYAELRGFGLTNDAHHMTAPRPDADQSSRCMKLALDDACMAPNEVDYVNAHGSSTPLNDTSETLAIKRVLGDHAYRVPISATKSMHGHALGATGAMEAALCCLALERGVIPPTINLTDPDDGLDLDYVPNVPRPAAIRTAISNSFGFGGINATLVFSRE
ncbi:MAG TPA: beta-ketoacyl-ACP synthase II [Armatimonadota bacterium]|jgi:3-oxoacyl-[acyl-carrier-protein] synthase II